MAIHRIPLDRLSPEALEGIIRECVSRYGTDYGEIELSWDAKCTQVKSRLESGLAVLLYDDDTETTTIVPTTDPTLKT